MAVVVVGDLDYAGRAAAERFIRTWFAPLEAFRAGGGSSGGGGGGAGGVGGVGGVGSGGSHLPGAMSIGRALAVVTRPEVAEDLIRGGGGGDARIRKHSRGDEERGDVRSQALGSAHGTAHHLNLRVGSSRDRRQEQAERAMQNPLRRLLSRRKTLDPNALKMPSFHLVTEYDPDPPTSVMFISYRCREPGFLGLELEVELACYPQLVKVLIQLRMAQAVEVGAAEGKFNDGDLAVVVLFEDSGNDAAPGEDGLSILCDFPGHTAVEVVLVATRPDAALLETGARLVFEELRLVREFGFRKEELAPLIDGMLQSEEGVGKATTKEHLKTITDVFNKSLSLAKGRIFDFSAIEKNIVHRIKGDLNLATDLHRHACDMLTEDRGFVCLLTTHNDAGHGEQKLQREGGADSADGGLGSVCEADMARWWRCAQDADLEVRWGAMAGVGNMSSRVVDLSELCPLVHLGEGSKASCMGKYKRNMELGDAPVAIKLRLTNGLNTVFRMSNIQEEAFVIHGSVNNCGYNQLFEAGIARNDVVFTALAALSDGGEAPTTEMLATMLGIDHMAFMWTVVVRSGVKVQVYLHNGVVGIIVKGALSRFEVAMQLLHALFAGARLPASSPGARVEQQQQQQQQQQRSRHPGDRGGGGSNSSGDGGGEGTKWGDDMSGEIYQTLNGEPHPFCGLPHHLCEGSMPFSSSPSDGGINESEGESTHSDGGRERGGASAKVEREAAIRVEFGRKVIFADIGSWNIEISACCFEQQDMIPLANMVTQYLGPIPSNPTS